MKIVAGLSGGVDSAVCAHLLLKQGHEVIGVFINQLNKEQDKEDARKVCENLGIEFQSLDYQQKFQDEIIQRFKDEQEQGLTPSPCCWCNPEFKFKSLLDYADKINADMVATGHYARIENSKLLRGKDNMKDQSYFLCGLTGKQLSRIIFPLGEKTKPEIREIAKSIGLIVHDKPDSNDMCFHIENKNLTIGQRIKEGGQKEKLYYLGNGKIGNVDSPELYKKDLIIRNFNFISAFDKDISCTAKVRYRQLDQKCKASNLGESRVGVVFEEPVRAVTPGQYCVLYDGDKVIGGGVIE